MSNSDREVISFDSALKEAPSVMVNMSRALRSEQKDPISILVPGFTRPVGNWLLENPDISGVGFCERNYDGKPSDVVVVCPFQRIVCDQMPRPLPPPSPLTAYQTWPVG